LFGLFPSSQISVHDTPDLARAAKRSLELRGDAATGWSLAWKVNLWARLGEAERAHELLKLLLAPDRSYTNLFDAHPPFQIDGNFGGASGILEMIAQSAPGRLHLLPALPKAWADGSIHGLRARQALTLSMSWRGGLLETLELCSGIDQTLTLFVSGGAARQVSLKAAERQVIEL
jgi:alpha-L-fucosidase 2